MGEPTVFDKIIAGQIPSYKLYEDEACIVILDINPIRKGHCLVISKVSVPTILDLSDDVLSNIISVVKKVDSKIRSALNASAVNVFVNDGKDAGQEIPHVHFHVIPRFKNDNKSFWEKEPYAEGEISKYFEKLKF